MELQCKIFYFGEYKSEVKERDHSEMKTCERLNYCPNIQPVALTFQNCPSGDLNRTIQGPVSTSHHPQTCIITSEDLHQNIRT